MEKTNNNLMDEKSIQLLKAIDQNDLEKVKKAISEGANVNIRDEWQITALGNATKNNHIEIVEILLQNNANVNIKNKDHYRALHYASRLNYLEITRMLLKYGAEVDTIDKNGNSPLSVAVSYYDEEKGIAIINLLLEHKANPLLKNNHGISPKMLVKDFVKTKSIETIFDSYTE